MTRFWRVALLTLLMALLPLRGWAWAVMPVSASGPAVAQVELSQPPCHAQAAMADAFDQAEAQPSAHDAHEPTAGSGHHAQTCSLCDLCHAGVIVPPSWAWFHDAPPVSPPSWAVSATHGRDGSDGLFRPPRA